MSKSKRRVKFWFLLSAVFLILASYPFLDNSLKSFLDESKDVHIDRVIDGDTAQFNGTSIRFLGINTPEHGEFFFQEAKDFLSENILNKTVHLEFVGDKTDKYGRTLAYVFLGNENINIKMVENGFANYYFYSGKDKYSDDILNAWKSCLQKNINLCEKSKDVCAQCITLGDNYIQNSCSFSCDVTNWTVKVEGREKFIFPKETLNPGQTENFKLNLENSAGSLFLRDSFGKLLVWKGP